MSETVLRISASEFKARCLAIFNDLAGRRLDRVVVTRRGRPVAELTPPRAEVADPWGAHRGSVSVPPGVDLTAPTLEEALDAEAGILHR
jgi:hypothetical protein